MQIIVTPHDIIQRCIWDKYLRFCLADKKKAEVEKIIIENKPISLSEDDAYVIGLLKIIETENLIHRFNEEVIESLQIKSDVIDDQLYIKKNTILKQIDDYLNKFPESYEPPNNYIETLEELKVYIKKIRKVVATLDITNIKRHDITVSYFNSKEIKKSLSL